MMYKFSWNADLYDSKHRFVSKYGIDLVDLLNPTKGERILDLGCGTGDLAYEAFMREAEVTGIDASSTMIQQASEKYPEIDFHVATAETFSYNAHFDGVLSNAVLHWIKDLEKPLTNVYKSLQPGGRFVAEMGGTGNVAIISRCIEQAIKEAGYTYKKINYPWFFTSIGTITSLMEKIGFRVTTANLFERTTPLKGDRGLRDWMIMFGEPFFKDVPEKGRENVLNLFEKCAEKELYKENVWYADYVRLRIVAHKLP